MRKQDIINERIYGFFMQQAIKQQLLTIKAASKWASDLLHCEISESNISYLIQYGKIAKYNDGSNGSVLIDLHDLKKYYSEYRNRRENAWKSCLGQDLNWHLSFENLREKDTTKHVHRLHPYKGKFIPQLVQYFLDSHIDDFKQEVYFSSGDIVLDPFSGSGTALVQANEMQIHAIGIDISNFNCMIAEAKLLDYDFSILAAEITKIKQALAEYATHSKIIFFENELLACLSQFNNAYFPSPGFKRQLQQKKIDERTYALKKEEEFLLIYTGLVKKYGIALNNFSAKNFLDKWYISNIRQEIEMIFSLIKQIKDVKSKKILAIILSRAIRSCRATTHSDLATLKEPQITTYYCWKHKKICKPLFSTMKWFDRYTVDTIARLKAFALFKTSAHHVVFSADSREVDVFNEVEKRDKQFGKLLKASKIKGIFTSPPYVGQIDYHEQHAYAYDLFGFERRDELEIGALFKGQSIAARSAYVDDITRVLRNCRRFLIDDFNVLIVANDKYNLYPQIAKQAGMRIVNRFKRPVLNRAERDKSPYAEVIFHLKSGE